MPISRTATTIRTQPSSGGQEGRGDGDAVRDDEVPDVVDEHDGVDDHPGPDGAPLAPEDDADARHEHRERREHERRAQDRPDAHGVASPRRRCRSRSR